MLCSRPFRSGVHEFGCGQCMPCRLNRRREWTGRLLLESCLHSDSMFVTLTYEDLNVPSDGVNVEDYQLFMKRLRKRVGKVRFYLCGEYGTKFGRPHYHAALFGSGCEHSVRKAWKLGAVHVGEVTPASMAYNCSHITASRPARGMLRSDGRNPEFSRMSLRPGIGADAVSGIALWLHTRSGARYMGEHGDVPNTIRIAGKVWPLGRYLTEKVREQYGMDRTAPESARRRGAAEIMGRLIAKGSLYYDPHNRVESERRAHAEQAQGKLKRGKVGHVF